TGHATRAPLGVGRTGRASNRLGVGSKIEMRAGSLSTRLERSAATPPVAPSNLVFGLGNRPGAVAPPTRVWVRGTRPGADAVRVLWPSGILQAEARESALPSPLVIQELDRK